MGRAVGSGMSIPMALAASGMSPGSGSCVPLHRQVIGKDRDKLLDGIKVSSAGRRSDVRAGCCRSGLSARPGDVSGVPRAGNSCRGVWKAQEGGFLQLPDRRAAPGWVGLCSRDRRRGNGLRLG